MVEDQFPKVNGRIACGWIFVWCFSKSNDNFSTYPFFFGSFDLAWFNFFVKLGRTLSRFSVRLDPTWFFSLIYISCTKFSVLQDLNFQSFLVTLGPLFPNVLSGLPMSVVIISNWNISKFVINILNTWIFRNKNKFVRSY